MQSLRLHTAYCFVFGLLFVIPPTGGAPFTRGRLWFTREPNKILYFMVGSDAVLEWDYSAANETTDFERIEWRVYNKSEEGYFLLQKEDQDDNDPVRPTLPTEYEGRVERKGRATLVIKDISFKDSTRFKCILKGKPGIPDSWSIVQLVVTGQATVHPVVQYGEVGGSATFTCNATGVPGQSFSWMRPNGQMKSKEVGHGERITIKSDTGSSQLTLKLTSIVDSGYYICDATVNIDQPNAGYCYLQLMFIKQPSDTED